jgi:hypothetical protein
MNPKRPEERLERVLDGFSNELLAASDLEVLAAAAEGVGTQPDRNDPAPLAGARALAEALRERTPK